MSELTDKEVKNLKPRAKLYKVTDRDGMYAAVTPTGVVSFRYQYRVNGRQEVLTIGRYSAEAARRLTRAAFDRQAHVIAQITGFPHPLARRLVERAHLVVGVRKDDAALVGRRLPLAVPAVD